ncbi:MAG: trypsin-like peptidase domain-containing protein [Candidatus Aenigmarchaeota archaeon]|nr:trypsin-like peptidase domain-containing protein [Candidatus Aenigmarchaeota archaeon]
MKKLLYVVVAFLLFMGVVYTQEWLVEGRELSESRELHRMFVGVAEGIAYAHSDRSKTTAVAVKRTKEGTWFVTAGHKADRDFPQSSKIDVKMDRGRETKMYTSLNSSIIVPDERGLDLLLFFVEGLQTKHVFKKFRAPYKYEENWVFGFRGGAGKVPGSTGYVTEYFTDRRFVFTSASAWFGCSGAPVVSRRGEVLGLAVRLVNESADGLFVSGSTVKEFIDKALKGQR